MSKFLSVDQQDIMRGLFLCVMLAVVQGVYAITTTGAVPTATQWHSIGMNAMNVFLAYVLKNFFTNADNQILKKDPTPVIGQ